MTHVKAGAAGGRLTAESGGEGGREKKEEKKGRANMARLDAGRREEVGKAREKRWTGTHLRITGSPFCCCWAMAGGFGKWRKDGGMDGGQDTVK